MPRLSRITALFLLAGCGDAARSAEQPRVAAAERVAIRFDALTETSGVAASAAHPGVIFTINDSGNEPEVYALDSLGNARGTWRLTDTRNTDWEALAAGPCDAPVTRCLFIADVGDNSARRRALRLHRIAEPDASRPSRAAGRVRPETRILRLEPGPRDIEAMYVGPTGVMYLITKRPERLPAGTLRPALVLALEPGPWLQEPTDTAVARIIDSLPIVPGSAVMRTITDASLSSDARWVAVRTYAEVYVFAADPATGRIITSVAPTRCDVSGLGEPGGEAITWLADGRLALFSEGRGQPFYRMRCEPPAR